MFNAKTRMKAELISGVSNYVISRHSFEHTMCFVYNWQVCGELRLCSVYLQNIQNSTTTFGLG
jgi:hypothetical protein